jgi:hypothetical protein
MQRSLLDFLGVDAIGRVWGVRAREEVCRYVCIFGRTHFDKLNRKGLFSSIVGEGDEHMQVLVKAN